MHVNHSPWSQHRLHRGLCSRPAAQRHQNATPARSRSRRAAMLESQPFPQMEWWCWEKWNKPQLSHQHTQKIGLLVNDPSATSWWRSQEDLTPLCLHNRGHKGENIASYITTSWTTFLLLLLSILLLLLCLVTADNYLVWKLQFISLPIQWYI